MIKPTIFLSHITEESDLASAFRREIDTRFLGLVEVFQSSDPSSMPVGTNWLGNITNALRGCRAMLLFCSPDSVKRPWINFECGANWSRDIEIVPICHSGMRPVDLPIPISLLQGVDAEHGPSLRLVFGMIAAKLNSATPDVDSDGLARDAKDFGAEYTIKRIIDENLRLIKNGLDSWLMEIFGKVPPNTVYPITAFPAPYFERISPALDALQSHGHAEYSWQPMGISIDGSPYSGQRGTLTVGFSQALYDRIHKP
jgi:hypothetical protein